jgi:hypothetical protein
MTPARDDGKRRSTVVDPPEHTHPHTDGTGAGLLGFCSGLGD